MVTTLAMIAQARARPRDGSPQGRRKRGGASPPGARRAASRRTIVNEVDEMATPRNMQSSAPAVSLAPTRILCSLAVLELQKNPHRDGDHVRPITRRST